MTTGATGSVLTDDLLARCLERAPKYDQENRFFQEDFDELKAASYLNIAVPKKLGGGGVSLAEVGRETRKLAYYAHATAVALNMHI
jgi:alkylation response protein AidB-like acyl-CoA dehydrogenase